MELKDLNDMQVKASGSIKRHEMWNCHMLLWWMRRWRQQLLPPTLLYLWCVCVRLCVCVCVKRHAPHLQDYCADELDTLDYRVLIARYRHPSFGGVGQQIPGHLYLSPGALWMMGVWREKIKSDVAVKTRSDYIAAAAFASPPLACLSQILTTLTHDSPSPARWCSNGTDSRD